MRISSVDVPAPPTVSYATPAAVGRDVALRVLIALWALATLAQVVTYWTMLTFNRWEIAVWPFPFDLQRPWIELPAAIVEGVGLVVVLLAVARRGGRWRTLLAIGGLLAGVGLAVDRAVFMEMPVRTFLRGYRQANAGGWWRSPLFEGLLLGFRVAQSLPRLAMPALCVVLARGRDRSRADG